MIRFFSELVPASSRSEIVPLTSKQDFPFRALFSAAGKPIRSEKKKKTPIRLTLEVELFVQRP
jgi:hypothetical protein